jgi:hypothetical protein
MPSNRPIGRNNLDKRLHRLYSGDVRYGHFGLEETRCLIALYPKSAEFGIL